MVSFMLDSNFDQFKSHPASKFAMVYLKNNNNNNKNPT